MGKKVLLRSLHKLAFFVFFIFPTALFLEIKVDLSNQSLEKIDLNEFKGQYVMSLNMSFNKLKYIEEEMKIAKFFRKLQVLDLSHNQIEYLNIIKLPESLKILNLSSNRLKDLKAILLAFPENLIELNLENNFFEVFNLDFGRSHTRYKGLKNLTILNLSNNKLKLLNGSGMNLLNSLKYLYLKNNQIKYIEKNLFPKTLIEIDLSNNKIDKMVDVHDLFSLKLLDLNSNKLDTLCNSCLPKSLVKLYLNNNMLKSIPNELHDLEELHVSNNSIEKLPDKAFYGLDSLFYLDLSHNKISEMNSFNFIEINNLKHLNLENNRIKSIQKLFNYYNFAPKLKTLNLKSNLLENLDPYGFQYLSSLKYLCLANNSIKQIKNSLDYLRNLITLDLSANNLSNIENVFNKLKNIESIDLSSQKVAIMNIEPFISEIVSDKSELSIFLNHNEFKLNDNLHRLTCDFLSFKNNQPMKNLLVYFNKSLFVNINECYLQFFKINNIQQSIELHLPSRNQIECHCSLYYILLKFNFKAKIICGNRNKCFSHQVCQNNNKPQYVNCSSNPKFCFD